MKKILITGGAGFIGSHVVRHFISTYPDYQLVNLDNLTYAGNLRNLTDEEDSPNYRFVKGDVVDAGFIDELFAQEQSDGVNHLAAETHVDRSITGPLAFVYTNVIGTVNLLNAARQTWKEDYANKRFYHISTDEVYGSLSETGMFTEETPYDPRSPYSIMDTKLNREPGTSEKLITYVTDRAGHDLPYAIDSSKLQQELDWKPSLQFEKGLEKTIDWYLQNQEWLNEVTSCHYQTY